MIVDLVQTTTRDGVRLDGTFQTPTAQAALPLDALCLVHGTGGNFYSSTLFDDIAAHFLDRGCGVLRVNTRGHDGISTAATAKGGRRQGAAYEMLDDCRYDIAAWLDWLRGRGAARVGLLGHSSGAVKAIYALAHEPKLPAAALIALSPPRLSYSWFGSSPQGPEFRLAYLKAKLAVAEGRPTELLDLTFPLPFVLTAAGYLEKYGPDERYNFLNFLAGVPCPVLITLGGGEVETNTAFQDLPTALKPVARQHGKMAVELVPGADHFYTGLRPELNTRLESWLRTLSAAD